MDYLDEIVGQDIAKDFLRNIIKKDQLYNLLFAGPRGVGKRQTAFALAKTINCHPGSPNFMLIAPIPAFKEKDKKEMIVEYMKNYLPENPIAPVEDRTYITIDQIRDLIEWLLLMPAKQTKRVAIILEADRMNEESANCFLKTLEEPPLDTVFILTSSRPNYLIPTIRSRCRTIRFGYLKPNQIQNVIFEGIDQFYLGSPGEILYVKNNSLFETARDIFRKAPLNMSGVAKYSRDLEKERLVDLFYALLLLYRAALYRKFGREVAQEFRADITRKVQKLDQTKIINTLYMLNRRINLLSQNPNHLLLLFDTLLKLP